MCKRCKRWRVKGTKDNDGDNRATHYAEGAKHGGKGYKLCKRWGAKGVKGTNDGEKGGKGYKRCI